MKIIVIFFVSTFLMNAQAPITNYFSTPQSEYANVSGALNEVPSGANAIWDFGILNALGMSVDTFSAPTASQLVDYPGTTQVLTITDVDMNTNDAFFKEDGADLFFTGGSNPLFTLDYNTDNAFIGTYPLIFGTSPSITDAISGQINTQDQSTTYTGTVMTQVDAYGSLSFDVIGLGVYTGSVTRIKSVQQLSFTLAVFPGSITITTYNYYKDSDGDLVFRTSEGTVNIPGLGITQSFSSAEALITNTLSDDNVDILGDGLILSPNPASDVLIITLKNPSVINSITLLDINGRTVLNQLNPNDSLTIDTLQSGVYMLCIITDLGTIRKRFIKQ